MKQPTVVKSSKLHGHAKCQLYYSAICTIIFILAVPCFLIVFGNFYAGFGCLATTVYSFLVFMERFHQHRGEPVLSHSHGTMLVAASVAGSLAGIALLLFCAITEGERHEHLNGTSRWLGVVWGTLLLKWAVTLGLVQRVLRKTLNPEYQPINQV